jgi:UDP-2,3-diacylglucosamine pyrophosphatase LpxH
LKPLVLAVLSDLHVGIGARAQDLRPDDLSRSLESGYKKKFLAFLRQQSIRADYLILPGDVSHMAGPSEFKLASELVTDVAKQLDVPQKRILFVPGNHDVDWSVLRASDSTGFRKSQRYEPLNHHEWIFCKIMQRGKPGVLEKPHFSLWKFDDILAVGYNSSWDDDPAKSVHHGMISDDHLGELEEQLKKTDLSSPRLRLFLVHHHPIQYSDPVGDPPDFSIMVNAERLLTVLHRYNFDLVIHGHKHKPSFGTYSVSSSSPLVVLCSGSFSALLDTRWSGLVNNQFHLIYVEGRDQELQNAYGRVESWTYLCASGWIPSKSHNGIRHIEPFGTYLQPQELKKTLKPMLQAELHHREYLEWSTIVKSLPRLKYVPPDRAADVLRSLAAELGYVLRGETLEDLILLRRGD